MRRAVDRFLNPTPGVWDPGPQKVAAIVTCHNYAQFLPRCLDSILSQQYSFSEIVVVDDSSTDGTKAVVEKYPSVKYVRGEWGNVCHARNAGMDATTAPLIVNVDADNWLGDQFLSILVPGMRDLDCAISYSRPLVVDDDYIPIGTQTCIQPFNYELLARDNLIDTCCLIRREAVDRVGRWVGNGKMGDWHLWLRLTRCGWKANYAGDGDWFYRDHRASMSRAEKGNDWNAHVDVMQDVMRLAVVTPFCGREWAVPYVMETYRRLDWDPQRLYLIAIDNGCDQDFSKSLRDQLFETCGHWRGVNIITTDHRSHSEVTNSEFAASAQLRMRNGFGSHMAHLYSDLAERSLGPGIDLVLTVEDDIEVITPNPLRTLLTGFRPETMCIGGLIYSRFKEAVGPIAYDIMSEHPYGHLNIQDRPNETATLRVGGLGMAFNLWRAEAWRWLMARRGSVEGQEHHDFHDCAFWANIRAAGYVPMLNWSVRTRHYSAKDIYV